MTKEENKEITKTENVIERPKIEQIKTIIPKMNFAEYKLNLKPELAAALKTFANVKHDMDEKTKEEWDSLLKEMQNRRIG